MILLTPVLPIRAILISSDLPDIIRHSPEFLAIAIVIAILE
jgi:hypothetical protein